MVNNIEKQTKEGLKETGIDKIIGVIKDVMSGLRPIIKIITTITKLLSALLTPIFLIIITMLVPILRMLKPFIKVLNYLMKPFLILAARTLKGGLSQKKAGDSTAMGKAFISSIGIILAGFSTVLVFVLKQAIDFSVRSILVGIAMVLDLILPSLNISFDSILNSYQTLSDELFLLFSNKMLDIAALLAEPFVEETEIFVENAKADFRKLIVGKDSLESTIIDKSKEIEIVTDVTLAAVVGTPNSIFNLLVSSGAEDLRNTGVQRVKQIIRDAKAKAAAIIAAAKASASKED